MRKLLLACLVALPAGAVDPNRLEQSIQPKLGRPYVWGASGAKSYDCSGFVWRSLWDAGVFLKRTTARKFFFSLPPAGPAERSNPGTLVFFDQVQHVGILRNGREFYHASSTQGTKLETFGPYWQRLVSGYRKVNIP